VLSRRENEKREIKTRKPMHVFGGVKATKTYKKAK
jgi:hypothetical protein